MHNLRMRAVVTGGLAGGAGDILFALVFAAFNGIGPVQLLQTVASGLLGKAAFEGGPPAAALGLVSHFILAFLWATVFVAVVTRKPSLVAKPVLAGAIFGVLVFFAMRLVVLPLSAFPYPVTFKPLSWGLDLLSHMFLFGTPIALAAAKAVKARAAR